MSTPPKLWKVQQYCYFWIASEIVTAEQVTAAVGIAPDSVTVRGSRRTDPTVIPVDHSWEIECRRHGPIDDQVTEVLDRIRPAAPKIRALVDGGQVRAGLMLVRHFDGADGGYDGMGWVLEPDQVALLADLRAEIQADEYLDNADPASY